jgi:hypothetical protein
MFDDWQSHMNKAEYRLSEDLYEGARDDCTKALAVAENDEQRAESYYQRGFACIGIISEKNNRANAIADWKKAADYGHNDAVRVLKKVVDITYTPQKASSSGSSSSEITFLNTGNFEGNKGMTAPAMPPNFTGRGRFQETAGIYEGDFVNGKLHGRGKVIYKYKGHGICEGEFENGRFVKGKKTLPTGYVYDGVFDDFGSGTGKLTHPDGRVEQGTFKYGKRV